MRALAIVVCVLAISARVDARVIMRPSVPDSCPSAPSWPKMTSCLAKFGKVTVVKSQGRAKIVQLSDARGRHGFRVPGIYLFTQQEGRWRLGGMFEGDDLHVIAFGVAPVRKRTLYRIDIGVAENVSLSVASVTRPVHLRKTQAVLCSGETAWCSVVVTSCDVFVEGKASYAFRGTLELGPDRVRLRGDRSTAGELCSVPADDEDVILPAVIDPDVM